MNKYLISHNDSYSQAADKIQPVDLAKIYNNCNDLSIIDEYDSPYDQYKLSSPWAVDKLPFKGIEKVYDAKKFNNIIRHFNLKY